MNISRNISRHADPFELFSAIAPVPNVIAFPSALNRREVERAARAILSGRSPGIDGWIAKRARQLAVAGVCEGAARRDVDAFAAAVARRISDLEADDA